MATRITQTFDRLKQEQKKGFIAYITAGDPSFDDTLDRVLRLEDQGVDLIELGVPFSDPLADGGVNQASATRALANGATPDGVIDLTARIRERSDIPIIYYAYLNVFLAHGGFNRNLRRMSKAGADGLLVLDLPVEELAPFEKPFEQHGIDNIRLVTPTSPPARIRRIVASGSGFVYCVSRAGVTGARKSISHDADAVVHRTRKATRLPVALGFGISTPEQARETARSPDAIVVGSAIVQAFAERAPTPRGRAAASRWVGRLVKAVKEL